MLRGLDAALVPLQPLTPLARFVPPAAAPFPVVVNVDVEGGSESQAIELDSESASVASSPKDPGDWSEDSESDLVHHGIIVD